MAAKSGSRKKAKGTGSIAAGKDSLNEKPENRILVLEKELQSGQEDLLARIDDLRRKNEGLEERLRERERAEQALHESEERFRILADDAPVLLWVNGLEGGEYVNRAYLEFLGVSSQVDIRHYDWSQYVHPDDREGYLDRYLDCFKRQARFEAQFRFRRHDGTYRWMKSVGRPRFNPAGQFLGFVGSTHDITDIKQIEAALRESEERLDFSLKSAGIGAWDLNLIDHTAWRSLRHDQIFGYREQLPEWTYEIFLSHVLPEDRDIVDSSFQKAVAGHVDCDYRCRIRRADGEVRWMWAHGRPVYDERGQPVRMLGINVDITRRKLMEDEVRRSRDELEVMVKARTEALRRSETGLKKSQEIAHLGSWELDLVNDRLTWSDEVYRIFGLQPQEFGATYEAFLEAVHPDDRAAVDTAYSSSIREGRDTYEIVHRVVRKTTGEVRYVHEKCAHFRDRSSRIIRSVGMVQDITEHKRVEDELKAAKQQAELYLDLMGHDINNMHQIAMGYLELARDIPAIGGQSEFLDKSFEVLQRSARLIKNVRKLQKLRDGAFQTEVIDVCKVLVDVQREFGAVPNKPVTLNLNGCESCRVNANELLHDVFANLVSNAIKHTGDQSDIAICLDIMEKNGRHCCTVVEDHGPGIPDEFKGKIFNRLLQGTDQTKGMGLGLYLVKSLVESYGGRVWVEDRVPGDHTKGARFVVMLPAVEK